MTTKNPIKKSSGAVNKRPPQPPKKMEIDELKNLEEPNIISKPTKERGRPRNKNYLSFAEAREFVRGELIPSRNKFQDWHDANNPKAIPKYPYRVYIDEWVSWNDFLGTNNVFSERVGKSWRDIEEAAMWVHSLKIETYAKWIEYCKENTLPEDIPARPDLVYSKWRTWAHWLGNKPIQKVEAIVEAQKLQIFYIIHEQGYPENVLTFGIDQMGPASFKSRWEQEQFQIIKMYWFDPKQAAHIKAVVNSLSSPYLGEDNTRICQNVWEILWNLSMCLELFRP
jgi:hypothetical protein